jgi:hypothetical protein
MKTIDGIAFLIGHYCYEAEKYVKKRYYKIKHRKYNVVSLEEAIKMVVKK